MQRDVVVKTRGKSSRRNLSVLLQTMFADDLVLMVDLSTRERAIYDYQYSDTHVQTVNTSPIF